MKSYVSKPKYVDGMPIDAQTDSWLRENGWTDFKLGDYYVKNKRGAEFIWRKESFEAEFELEEK